jgi:hypothetical protein
MPTPPPTAPRPPVHPPTVVDHRGATPVTHPPVVHPVSPTPVPPTVVHPVAPVHPVVPPVHHEPPRAHHEHHDYVFLENYGWWPRWYPYWDPGWYAYWWQLYEYYGGDAYREYAEWARDQALRAYAAQMGWL